jgi:hypothetical protein
VRTRPLLRLTLALAASSALLACSGGGGSSDADDAGPVLAGDYLSTAGSKGDFQEIAFIDASHYEEVPWGCEVSTGCERSGTYTFDGSMLTLTDDETKTSTDYPIRDLTTSKPTTLLDEPLVHAPDGGVLQNTMQQIFDGAVSTGTSIISGTQPSLTFHTEGSLVSGFSTGSNTLEGAGS